MKEEANQMGMTGAQYLLSQGRKEGRQEGRVEGQQEILLNQLEGKFGELSDSVRERVAGWSSARIRTAAKQVLTANSLSELGLE